jgi:hypothetical protein
MPKSADLDAAIEIIIVDAYGETSGTRPSSPSSPSRPRYPPKAPLLGTLVTVTGFDYLNEVRGLTATCQAPDSIGEVALFDLTFPPDTETAWIHAAYRHYLGLQPLPADPGPDWTWPTWS